MQTNIDHNFNSCCPFYGNFDEAKLLKINNNTDTNYTHTPFSCSYTNPHSNALPFKIKRVHASSQK